MKETVERLRSAHLNNERPIWIREPADPSNATRMAVFLDGELYRERMDAVPVIEKLVADREIADAWWVFVSMESVESRWRECPCHSPFAKFVVEELLPWMGERFPEVRNVRERTLVGLSYTGLAAAFVAKKYPGKFQKVVSQSGSFWFEECRLADEFRTLPNPLPTDFYLDVGMQETKENVQHREDVLQKVSQLEGVRRFRDALLENGHSVRYVEFDGGHDFSAWRKTLEGALKWAVPNKSPEPTPTAVTPRAAERGSK